MVDSRKVLKDDKRFIWLVILLTCFFLVFSSIMIYRYATIPRIRFTYGRVITLNYQEEFKEPGFRVLLNRKDLSNYVSVTSHVNPYVLGDYYVVYTLEYEDITKEFRRKVRIRDIEAPVITLIGEDRVYVCPGEEYFEEGFIAIDNYDGDITSQVNVLRRRDSIIYSVSDSSGNWGSATRTIIHEDNEAPVILLHEDRDIFLPLNGEFVEPGFSVIDNCDRGLESRVEVTGYVDTTTSGIYYLEYRVTDLSGNEAIATRRVIVGDEYRAGVIYLTFDDGPRSGITDGILDILKEEGVHATFFVMNTGPDELLRRIYDEGHTVGLHSATHDFSFIYSSPENFFNDLNSVSERVRRVTGERSRIIRFAGGSSNTISRRYYPGIMTILVDEVLRRGYLYYDWNIDSHDLSRGITRYEITDNVVSQLSRDRVNMVLLHDTRIETKYAVRKIIHYANANGYEFGVITQRTRMVHQRVAN